MTYASHGERPRWQGPPPFVSDYIDCLSTVISDLDRATIAEALAEIPYLARELEAARQGAGLAGPAYVSPHAIIGQDVYLGPGCKVYEFSTVRDGSIIDANAVIGFGNEIAGSYVGPDSVVAHSSTITASLIGRAAHLTAGVTLGSVSLRNPDMLRPTRTIKIPMADGSVHDTGVAKFGALIGDGTRIGMHTAVHAGVLLNRGLLIGSMLNLRAGIYTESVLSRDPA